MIELFIFLLITLPFAFILLYPYYLRDKKPASYIGVWRVIGSIFRNRYGAAVVLHVYLAVSIPRLVGVFTQQDPTIGWLAIIIYLLVVTPTLLWYPLHLKDKRPEKYKGIWRRIGEWLGDPRIAFPIRRK